jgi:hypothetical protein
MAKDRKKKKRSSQSLKGLENKPDNPFAGLKSWPGQQKSNHQSQFSGGFKTMTRKSLGSRGK